jgi:hypothetical protein
VPSFLSGPLCHIAAALHSFNRQPDGVKLLDAAQLLVRGMWVGTVLNLPACTLMHLCWTLQHVFHLK